MRKTNPTNHATGENKIRAQSLHRDFETVQETRWLKPKPKEASSTNPSTSGSENTTHYELRYKGRVQSQLGVRVFTRRREPHITGKLDQIHL